jgi:aquaporin Z
MKPKSLVAEFIGTFALIYVGILVIKHLGAVPGGLIGIAFAHGLAIAVAASSVAAISGGHLNPAVTFAMLLTKRIDVAGALGYWIAQLFGATVAAFLAGLSVGPDGQAAVIGATPALASGIDVGSAIMMEAVGTFFLVLAVFGTAVDGRGPKLGALLIGLSITMMIFAIGPQTGCAINPARWFGPAVVGGQWTNALVWTIGPLLGGGIAGLLYQHFFLEVDRTPSD